MEPIKTLIFQILAESRNHVAHSHGIVLLTSQTNKFCFGAKAANMRAKAQKECINKVKRRHG
jgi:hypothetical protein